MVSPLLPEPAESATAADIVVAPATSAVYSVESTEQGSTAWEFVAGATFVDNVLLKCIEVFRSPLAPLSALSQATSTTTSNTTDEGKAESARLEVVEVLAEARYDDFDFGSESRLSANILRLLARYETVAVEVLDFALRATPLTVDIIGETLRTLGRAQGQRTYSARRRTIARFLRSPDIRVRHVAASGLAELDDPITIRHLTDAFNREQSERLQAHFARVLEQLRATERCLSS